MTRRATPEEHADHDRDLRKHDDTPVKTRGQLAYEIDCEREPTYHDETTRKTWAELPGYARWSWERKPTPRARAREG